MEDSEIKNTVNYEGIIFMSKNKEIKPEEKIQYVEEYLDGKISKSEIARKLGLKKESVRAWIAKYQSEGSAALLKHKLFIFISPLSLVFISYELDMFARFLKPISFKQT